MDGSLDSISDDASANGATPPGRGTGVWRTRAKSRASAMRALAMTIAALVTAPLAPVAANANKGRVADAGIGILRPLGAVDTPIQLPAVVASLGEAKPAVATREPKIVVYQTDVPQNFEVSLRLNPASSEAEGEVALRLSSPRDYYAVRLDTRGERVVFLRVRDGRAEEVANAERRLASNTWHHLLVRAEDNRFTVTLDGEWLFTAYDAAWHDAGRLAVWSAPGSPVRFDAIAVNPLAP